MTDRRHPIDATYYDTGKVACVLTCRECGWTRKIKRHTRLRQYYRQRTRTRDEIAEATAFALHEHKGAWKEGAQCC